MENDRTAMLLVVAFVVTLALFAAGVIALAFGVDMGFFSVPGA